MEIGSKLFAYCPCPLLPGHHQAKPFCSSNLLNPVVCEHRPCSVSAFEEKFSKAYVSAHPGKQGPPSGQSLWLTRQKSLVRICKFRTLSVSLYLPNLGIRAYSSIYIYQEFAELTVLVSVPNMYGEKMSRVVFSSFIAINCLRLWRVLATSWQTHLYLTTKIISFCFFGVTTTTCRTRHKHHQWRTMFQIILSCKKNMKLCFWHFPFMLKNEIWKHSESNFHVCVSFGKMDNRQRTAKEPLENCQCPWIPRNT